MNDNPFGVKNPEDLEPDYIAQHFVDMFTDFAKVKNHENSFIHGARGTGKSMMMRGLETAVMLKSRRCLITDLPHLGVHVPLRRRSFSVPELSRPSTTAATAISEHMLVMYITYRLASSLKGILGNEQQRDISDCASLFEGLLRDCGGEPKLAQTEVSHPDDNLQWMMENCDREMVAIGQFAKRVVFDRNVVYRGALSGFSDFLLPLVAKLTSSPSMPHVPVFIMLDDADNLSANMQRVLNSWVSMRVVDKICLKITTQLGYATYRTVDGRLIEYPHDFCEIDIASVYTNKHDRFYRRVFEIASRRLQLAGISTDPETFFPSDEKQKRRLEEIRDQIRVESEARHAMAAVSAAKPGASRVRDDVTRYAVPKLMRSLAGSSKSSHTFSYAGFSSLVDLSSGVIRWFLEPAARMYDEVSSAKSQPVLAIPSAVQDEVIYTWSKEFAERLKTTSPNESPNELVVRETDDVSLHSIGHEGPIAECLRNLVFALGSFFRKRLMDETASEQRAFSIMIRGVIPQELADVLAYGVRLGYFQRADNAAKEAFAGRYPRYILARRLGPYFKLDISGYAAHISVTADMLSGAMHDPDGFVKTRSGKNTAPGQMSLNLKTDDED